MRIIVAMDIIEGRCVRLTQGNFTDRKVYPDSPLEMAKQLERDGIRYLHFVDLDGARTGRPVNTGVMKQIATATSLTIDYGGGIRTTDHVEMVFASGASQVTAGSIAVTDRNLVLAWLNRFGAERIVLGADVRGRKISTEGWRSDSETDVIKFIGDYSLNGIKDVICTDISRDGTLTGPSLSLYREIIAVTGVRLIASGGVSSVSDLEDLAGAGCAGTIIGKAIYEGKINPADLKRYA